jgi:hypothetical protein
MPKKPIDYSKCCIYKIEHLDNESLIYVGHTTNFKQRKAAHKINCINIKRREFNHKIYKMIRENGGWEMLQMIEIEKHPCSDKREATRREFEVMKELKATMNMVKSYESIEDRKERKRKWNIKKNKEYIQEKKEYEEYKLSKSYKKNKEFIQEKQEYEEYKLSKSYKKIYDECMFELDFFMN